MENKKQIQVKCVRTCMSLFVGERERVCNKEKKKEDRERNGVDSGMLEEGRRNYILCRESKSLHKYGMGNKNI